MSLGFPLPALVLATAFSSACAGATMPATPRPATRTTELPAAEPSVAPRLEPFSMLAADPERKAKLVARAPRLDSFFAARLAEVGATGGAVGIVLEGELVYARGFGVRDVESKAPVDGDTVFRIGSVSKTITALAILRLRDQGKLVLDEPAAKYWPALRSLRPPTEDSPPVSVRHLLSMTSGLPYDDIWGPVTFGRSDEELARMLGEGLSFAGAPGERYRYSNLGFALLGKIVEHVSGQQFESYVASEIFGPLGMTSSGYVSGGFPVERTAIGYFREGSELIAEPTPSDGVFAPAGGAYTSLNDLARYAAFQLAAYPPRNAPETGPVRRSTLREMHTGQAWGRFADDVPVAKRTPDGALGLAAHSYGLGWSTSTTCYFEGMVQHFGFEPGYFASVRLVPRAGFAVVSLSTTSAIADLRTFELLTEVLREGGVLEPRPLSAPSELVAARDVVIRLLGAWDSELVARSFDRTRCATRSCATSEEMWSASDAITAPAGRRATSWRSAGATVGSGSPASAAPSMSSSISRQKRLRSFSSSNGSRSCR